MNTVVIVDTDVVSFLLKGDTRAQSYRPHLEGNTLALSFMTVAELYQWAYIRNWGKEKLTRLEEQLRAYVIVPYDNELCKQWAMVCVERQRLAALFRCKMPGLQPLPCAMDVHWSLTTATISPTSPV